MHIKNKRGQSTVEYILLATAVIAVIIALVSTSGSLFRNQLNTTLNTAIGQVGDLTTRLVNSEGIQPPGGTGVPTTYNVKVE